MDIHAPEGPTNSFKDFAIHIIIVTIGILIALGLEGIRETIHNHRQVAETREIFRVELHANQGRLVQQRRALKDTIHQLDDLLANLDELNAQPGKISAAVGNIEPGFYFFTTVSWESALSTGVLDHMSPAEVVRFASETVGVRDYVNAQDQGVLRWYEAKSILKSRSTLTPQQLEDGRQKLQLFRLYCDSMNHLLDELSDDIEKAVKQN
jgi:hypothetical protein